MPDLYTPGQCQEGQDKGLDHHENQHGHDDLALILVFNQHATGQGQKQGWQGGRKADDAQVERTAGDLICQVGLGGVLYPGANQRDELAGQNMRKSREARAGKRPGSS